MSTRRIVTGRDGQGKSVVVFDGTAPRTTPFEHVPGFVPALLWETAPDPAMPAAGSTADPSVDAPSLVPEIGATSLQVVVFPPDAVMAAPGFDGAAAAVEYARHLPGLAQTFEPDHPGMHTTRSVDYGVLLEGEIWLELDDAVSVRLQPHDVVVQNGTRHAWRNRSQAPAKMLFVLVGARRGEP